jgi:diguanylate cyclase (GGDEF)-like protein
MRFKPDTELSTLVAQIVERRKETALRALHDRKEGVRTDFGRRGTYGSGGMFGRIYEEFAVVFRDFAATATEDLAELTSTLTSADAIDWVRGQLDQYLEAFSRGLSAAAREGTPGGSGRHAEEDRNLDAKLLAEARREANIRFEMGLRKRPATPEVSVVDEARRDSLTAIPNRRGFEEDLTRLMDDAIKTGLPLALVQIDVDHFKNVNDDHGGHATGDEALRAIAGIAERCAKGKGVAYRVGGDEFSALLPNHSGAEAICVAERLRSTLEATTITSRSLQVTVSVGIAVFPEHAGDMKELMEAADQAAYDSKRLGRNLVRVCGEQGAGARPRTPQRKAPAPQGIEDQSGTTA